VCGQCPPGYQGNGQVCTFLGVCTVNNGGCHPLARCLDNPRKYNQIFPSRTVSQDAMSVVYFEDF
jgi:hypothetical protein